MYAFIDTEAGRRISAHEPAAPEADDLRGRRSRHAKTARSRDTGFVPESHWHYVDHAVPCPLGYGRLHMYWKEACRAEGSEDLHIHDLRHLHGQWAMDAGAPQRAAQGSLRHASPTQTARYVRKREQRTAGAAGATVIGHAPDADEIPLKVPQLPPRRRDARRWGRASRELHRVVVTPLGVDG